MASTSSSFKTTYDVFLSFRGADTRDNFTSHLYTALCRENIRTFIDDGLNRGEEIDSSLMKVIEESKISVIVFSIGYASSPYCLDELVKILECRKTMRRTAFPIFYRVDPTDVEKQDGVFGDNFRKLEAENKQSMDNWRNALKEAASLSGWDSKNYRLESDLIEKVAEFIKELCPITYTAPSSLVGIDWQFQKIISLLRIDQATDGCHSVGVWGMGGIGKTATAKCIFREISYKFNRCSIFPDVREKSKLGEEGLIREFYSKLGFETKDVQTVDVVPTSIGDTLRKEKVLVVLDDVNDPKQLEALLTNVPYGPGSRIIVTSRDKQVLLNGVHEDEIYEMKGLNYSNALQLLSMKAFKKMHPPKEYEKLSNRAVEYAGGVPLALQVLGSHLCRKLPKDWEKLFTKLAKSPEADIQKILKVSYDELDPGEQSIFLDIACFFKGSYKDSVIDILDGWVLSRLEDKCLISIDEFKTIRMHDLIEEMGKDIAARGKTRFWDFKNICQPLFTNTETEAVEGIVFDTHGHKKVDLHPMAFSTMHNLRILKIYDSSPHWGKQTTVFAIQSVKSDDPKCLPSKLIVLVWEGYPYKSLDSSLFIENLVELNLQRSNIIQLCDGENIPLKLKKLNLSYCHHLKKIPNLSSATNLEEILLRYCESLEEIQLSIDLHKLIRLDLDECKMLGKLLEIPSGIKKLNMRNCKILKDIELSIGLHELSVLNLDGCKNLTKLSEIPSGIKELNMRNCKSLKEIELSIGLHKLSVLNLDGCENLRMLSGIPRGIQILHLQNSGVTEWSPSIPLDNLQELNMKNCSIKSLPRLTFKCIPPDHEGDYFELRNCRNLSELPDISGRIPRINLEGSAIKELPSSLGSLSSLVKLNLIGCSELGELPPLGGLTSLRRLWLDGTALQKIPNDIVSLSSLRFLSLRNCKRLQGLLELPKQLQVLNVQNCTSLRTVKSSFFLPRSGRDYNWGRDYNLDFEDCIMYCDYLYNYCNCLNLVENNRSKILKEAEDTFKSSEEAEDTFESSEEESEDTFESSEEEEEDTFKSSEFDDFGQKFIQFCVPGSEIPGWYEHQSEGYSISVPNSFKKGVVKIDFSVVLELDSCFDSSIRIECSCSLKKVNNLLDIRKCKRYEMDIDGHVKSDHVFLWNASVENWSSDVIEALFEFKAQKKFNEETSEVKIKKCGVHYRKRRIEGIDAASLSSYMDTNNRSRENNE